MQLTQTVVMSVFVGEDSSLEHFVWRKFDPGDNVGGREGGLFHFGEIVGWVLVQDELSDRNQWEFTMRPDFGEVEGVE